MRKTLILLVFTAACATQPAPTNSSSPTSTNEASSTSTPAAATTAAATPPQPDYSPHTVPLPARGQVCRTAVPVKATTEAEGRQFEDAWLAENYPGASGFTRARIDCKGMTVDEVRFRTANGIDRTFYFDVSAFAGK